MPTLASDNYEHAFANAQDALAGQPPAPADDDARIAQWKRDEWHAWFRWKVCRAGIDWSKPAWLFLLSAGFAALIWYGLHTGKLFVTAGGIVLWFTIVNLGFFTYFGLILLCPPRTVPGPFAPGVRLRAKIGIYPPGYERRKLARVWVRLPNSEGGSWLFELPFTTLPDDLSALMKKQSTWRIQRGEAPATDAIVETVPVSRAEINAGAHPLKVVAWRWDEHSLEPFNRRTGVPPMSS